MQTLLRTPLYRCHLQLGARIVPFAGFEMPVQYTGVLEEAKMVRTAAGLFDVSHMGQVSVRGKDALEQVQRLVTNDLTRLKVGQAQYNFLCNEAGGVIDDLVIYRKSEEEIFICVNASNRVADVEWFQAHLGSSVSWEDVSDETALIALQGPSAEAILRELGDASTVTGLKYYWAASTSLLGRPCFLSRTGYTGEDGFELYIAKGDAAHFWEGLLEHGRKKGLVPAGLGARDTLRLEMGYALHGHEISPQITPLQAGLGWVVKLDRPTPFIGQKALQQEKAQGLPRMLRAFQVEDRRIARQGYRIVRHDHTVVGSITSGSFSPHVNAPIALGFVDAGTAAEEKLFVEVREAKVPLKTVKLPFVPSRVKKN